MLSCLRTLLLVAAGTLILCWPAFYNGYPLQWYDSLGYLTASWIGAGVPILRSPFYGLAIAPLMIFNSLWAVVLAQSALAAATILLVQRATSGGLKLGQYPLVMLLLGLLTSLPWHSCYIMADVFAGLVPLGIFLLIFARDRLGPVELAFVFAGTVLAVLAHYSHLPLCVAVCLAALGLLLWQRAPRAEMVRATGLCLALVAIAAGGQVAVQWLQTGEATIAPDGPVFLLARLTEDGQAGDYLVRHCPETHFAFCAYTQNLPMKSDHFLWAADGPVKKLGGVHAVRDEASLIVAGAIREEPLRFALNSAEHALDQFVRIDMGDYVHSYRGGVARWKDTAALMQVHLPGELKAFMQSRESAGGIGMQRLFSLEPAVVVISAIALLIVCTMSRLWRDHRIQGLVCLVVVTLVTNAVVCGALSGPSERYQNRLIWLVPFLLCVAVLAAVNARRKSPSDTL